MYEGIIDGISKCKNVGNEVGKFIGIIESAIDGFIVVGLNDGIELLQFFPLLLVLPFPLLPSLPLHPLSSLFKYLSSFSL
jgi:hypothetical protein